MSSKPSNNAQMAQAQAKKDATIALDQNLLHMNCIEGARSIHPKISQATNEYDYLQEKVRIQFFNLDQPGNDQLFMCGPCTDPDSFTLEHGKIYDLSRAHVRFVETRQQPQYAYKPLPNGKLQKQLVGYSPRFQCRPVWERKGG